MYVCELFVDNILFIFIYGGLILLDMKKPALPRVPPPRVREKSRFISAPFTRLYLTYT